MSKEQEQNTEEERGQEITNEDASSRYKIGVKDGEKSTNNPHGQDTNPAATDASHEVEDEEAHVANMAHGHDTNSAATRREVEDEEAPVTNNPHGQNTNPAATDASQEVDDQEALVTYPQSPPQDGSSSNDQGEQRIEGSFGAPVPSFESSNQTNPDVDQDGHPLDLSADPDPASSQFLNDEVKDNHEKLINELDMAIKQSGVLEKMKEQLKFGDDGLRTSELAKVTTPKKLLRSLERNETIGPGNYCTLIGVLWKIGQKSLIRLIEEYQYKIYAEKYLSANPRSAQHRGISYDKSLKSKTGKRGLLVIVNQFTKTRKGAEDDEISLEQLFNRFEFDVKTYRNLKRKALMRKLKGIREDVTNEEYPQLFFAMLSHGNKDGILTYTNKSPRQKKSTECITVTVEDIVKMFTCSEAFMDLIGKPKVFLIEACRGGKEMLKYDAEYDADPGESEESEEPSPLKFTTAAESDVLICHSQCKGFKSVRSWFIQAFCDIVEKKHHRSHLLEMLTMVNREIAENKQKKSTDFSHVVVGQVPTQLSTLTKDLYL